MSEKWEELVEQALRELRQETREKEMAKIEDEVFDRETLKALSKFISAGQIDTLDYCLSTGKEANVFRATTPEGAHVAVKVYRVFTSSFRSHQDYIWGDPRFQTNKTSKRELVSTWATKEFKNLSRLLDAGCRVPTPVQVKDNVLIMEFVGDEGLGAPLLQRTRIHDYRAAFDELVDFTRTAWQEAKLVHGDLSEYNVLVMPDELVVIDVAQAVVRDHPRSAELLERDVGNLVRYFQKKDVPADAEALLEDIRGDEEEDDGDDRDAGDDEDDEGDDDGDGHEDLDENDDGPAGGERSWNSR